MRIRGGLVLGRSLLSFEQASYDEFTSSDVGCDDARAHIALQNR